MAERSWERPLTTKLYLHPPLAERICLLTPDMKIINASLKPDGRHLNQPAFGIMMLRGEDFQPFDCQKTSFDEVKPGAPVYTVKHCTGEIAVFMEAFCNTDRNPTTYFSVTVVNTSPYKKKERLGFLVRSGADSYLTCQHMEGYGLYQTNVKTWYMLKRTWKRTGETTEADGMGALRLQIPQGVSYRFISDPEDGKMFSPADFFCVDMELAPGEKKVIEGALCAHAEPAAFDYQAEREKTVDAWRGFLRSMRVIPDTDDAEVTGAYRQLAVQLLQMLARYEGSDLVTPRQGDLGRLVWPFEATIFLNVLDKIGLNAFTADAYRYLIETKMGKEGEETGHIGGANGWDNFTGATIWGLSEHLKYARDPDQMAEFLPSLMKMFGWIEKRRHQPSQGRYGIFPAGRGSDWVDVAQFWTLTDCYNAMGERSLAEALEQYDCPEQSQVRAAYEEYASILTGIRDELYAGHEEDDAYILPHELGVPFEDTEQYSYYCDGAPIMLLTGFMDPCSRMRKQMEAFFEKRGQFENGMTARMTNCNWGYDSAFIVGYGDVWYTQHSEYYWIKCWMAAGEREKALRTLKACMKYGMTKEYAVAERYCSRNPFYSPWQPNASGSARLMQSMLAVYGERTVS